MINVSTEAILGNFEEWETTDEKISDLQSQIKMLKEEKKQEMEEYAKEIETKPENITGAYKHWKKVKDKGPDPDTEDLYEIIARIDMAFEGEGEDDTKNGPAAAP